MKIQRFLASLRTWLSLNFKNWPFCNEIAQILNNFPIFFSPSPAALIAFFCINNSIHAPQKNATYFLILHLCSSHTTLPIKVVSSTYVRIKGVINISQRSTGTIFLSQTKGKLHLRTYLQNKIKKGVKNNAS